MFSAGDPVVKQLYFFTKLKTYDNGTCFDRRVGSGSWSKDKFCKTSLKGIEKSRFRYENNENSPSKQNGNWILYEYKDLNPPNQDVSIVSFCFSFFFFQFLKFNIGFSVWITNTSFSDKLMLIIPVCYSYLPAQSIWLFLTQSVSVHVGAL